MPYKKSYGKKRYNGGGARYQRNNYALVNKLNFDMKYMRTLINSEMHSFLVSAGSNIDSTGVVSSLNIIAQGDDEANRTGNSILPRYQSINLHVNKKITSAGTVDHETIRVMLFRYWGEATSGSAPSVTISEVLDTAHPLSYLNEDNTGKRGDRDRRIEVHKSKLFTLDSVANTSRTWKWNVEVNGLNKKVKDHIKFRNNTTFQPISGGFYILFVSDNSTGGNKSAFEFTSKINFHDN